MFLIEAVLTDPSASVEERQKALSRIFSDPGVPSKQSTAPFWLRDPHALSKCQSSTLPTEADVVIIGSGVTGASIARTLLQDRTDGSGSSGHPAVVMLEARDVCSGATGRNGGHILETGEEFMEFVETVGVDNAKKIMKFRLAHLKEMLGAAERFGLTTECQARRVQFLSVYFDERRWKEGLASITKFKEIMPEEAAEWATFERGEIPQVSLINHP